MFLSLSPPQSGKDPRAILRCHPTLLVACDEAPEKALVLQLCKLTDVLELFCETLMPHHCASLSLLSLLFLLFVQYFCPFQIADRLI